MPSSRRSRPGVGPAEGAAAEADEQAWSDYLEMLAPYVVALMLVPLGDPRGAPRSLLELHEQVRDVGVTREWLRKHAYLSQANFDAGRWWVLVLHQFTHSDVSHLSNNLATIVMFGRGVHKRLGTRRAFYTLLLGGGALCGYADVLGKKRRLDAQVFAEVQGVLPRIGSPTSRAGRWYDATMDRFAGWMTSYIGPHIATIGASGGACCLMGASVVINIEELADATSELVGARRRSPAEREVVLRRSVVRLGFIGFNLLSLGSCFLRELAMTKPRRGDRVNHRSHVDGFMIGAAFYCAWRYGPRVWARLKDCRTGGRGGSSGQSRGGGGGGDGGSESIWD